MRVMHAVRAAVIMTALGACNGEHAANPDAFVPSDVSQPYFRSPVTYSGVDAVSAVAIGDVNGDRTLDIVVAGGHQVGSVGVLLSAGGGTFDSPTVYSVGKIPSAITAVDLDRDGRADIALTDVGSEAAFVARANLDGSLGSWTSYSVGPWPVSIIAADVNADGSLDLVTANNLGQTSESTICSATAAGTSSRNRVKRPGPTRSSSSRMSSTKARAFSSLLVAAHSRHSSGIRLRARASRLPISTATATMMCSSQRLT